MREVTEEEWKSLEQKYKAPDFELVRLDLRMGTIVFRNPTEAEYNMFQAQRLSDDQKKLAFPNLMKMCCVFPEGGELGAAMKRFPGLGSNVQVVRALQYLAGEADALAGKG